MDKPLSDNKKDQSAPKEDRKGGASHATPESIGAYSGVSAHDWEATGTPWNASPQGRFAIRLVTRGVMGAAFFTVGGALAGKWMKNYDTEASLLKQDNPLAFISKLIDITVGKPVEVAVRNFGTITGMEKEAAHRLGKRAVTFRPTNNFTTAKSMPSGRSLGHEMSMVTFDFFCASIGDAWGRDIAGWVDPNVKKEWLKDGKIEWPKAITQALKSTWRYVTYNGGEDWGVALPYVYFMKGQRALLNKFTPGFEYDFDRGLHGGSAKMEDGKIVGNYHRTGIFDLQSRFTVYNMGTVAYRELYNHVADTLAGKKSVLYGAVDKPEVHGVVAKAANVVKWMVRSIVKGGIYMTPATPFFWITRTPQSKYNGAIIDQKKGLLLYKGTDGASHLLTPEYFEDPKNYINGQLQMPHEPHYAVPDLVQRRLNNHQPATSLPLEYLQKPYGQSFGTFDSAINFTGRVNDKARRELLGQATKLNEAGHYMEHTMVAGKPALQIKSGYVGKEVKNALGKDLRWLANNYVNAAFSYMPYMYAKAEAANLWDDGKMDLSIERAIDGAASFNFREFKAGLREIGYAFLHKPLPEAHREREAQRRIEIDDSAADVFAETKGEMQHKDTMHRHLDDNRKKLSWRERLVTGKKEDKLEVGANNPKKYAEKEAMKKALDEAQPPTNSIH